MIKPPKLYTGGSNRILAPTKLASQLSDFSSPAMAFCLCRSKAVSRDLILASCKVQLFFDQIQIQKSGKIWENPWGTAGLFTKKKGAQNRPSWQKELKSRPVLWFFHCTSTEESFGKHVKKHGPSRRNTLIPKKQLHCIVGLQQIKRKFPRCLFHKKPQQLPKATELTTSPGFLLHREVIC